MDTTTPTRHRQEFLTLRSGKIIAACACEWQGDPAGHWLRKDAAAEYAAHKAPARPYIHPDGEPLDELATPATVVIPGRKLRAGMVLIDPELGTPAAIIDHKAGRFSNGAAPFLVNDLDRGGWITVPFGENAQVRVMAR